MRLEECSGTVVFNMGETRTYLSAAKKIKLITVMRQMGAQIISSIWFLRRWKRQNPEYHWS